MSNKELVNDWTALIDKSTMKVDAASFHKSLNDIIKVVMSNMKENIPEVAICLAVAGCIEALKKKESHVGLEALMKVNPFIITNDLSGRTTDYTDSNEFLNAVEMCNMHAMTNCFLKNE